jgi:hypothetical protein
VIVNFLAILGHASLSTDWFMLLSVGALLSFVTASFLSNTEAGGRGIPFGEVVKDCPIWLKRTNYVFLAYLALTLLSVTFRYPGALHWRKVEMSDFDGLIVLSAFAMDFYLAAFSMLFGKLFGKNAQNVTLSERTHKTT